jgi:hypothetical protein
MALFHGTPARPRGQAPTTDPARPGVPTISSPYGSRQQAGRRADSGRVALRRQRSTAETPRMDWQTTYRIAADRHRDRAVSAQAVHLLYQAALHERAIELLEAESRESGRIRVAAPRSESRLTSCWVARKALHSDTIQP